ncbi:MAG: hypothetical protein JST26_20640 [Bacteroidetes bacterium]|nr:hypothetical protein [Bacteroidota bacterium]
MNKKIHTFFFSFLVFIYTITSIGIPVYYHYCGGELEKVSALIKAKSCCGSSDEQDNCCKNEVKHYSLHAEFSHSGILKPVYDASYINIFVHQLPEFFSNQNFKATDHPVFCADDSSPPDPWALLLVKTSVFRI